MVIKQESTDHRYVECSMQIFKLKTYFVKDGVNQ